MASIRKRGGRWQAQVRRKGQPPLTKSFTNKADASAWARQKELLADRQELHPDTRVLETTTLAELIKRYRDDVSSTKRGGDIEVIVLNAFLRHSLSRQSLSSLTQSHFARYRDERLKQVQPQTLKRQLTLLSSVFKTARDEWDIPLANPLEKLKLKYIDQRRERRLVDDEQERLLTAARESRNPVVLPAIVIAIETAMRRGELLAMQWEHVDLSNSTLLIPLTKNGHARTIPLSSYASRVLHSLDQTNPDVFPITPNALRKSWSRIVQRAEIEDLHFHDLRHEAISRFFEMGLNIAEVASISGHKDIKMLFRYTHPKVGDILNKINA